MSSTLKEFADSLYTDLKPGMYVVTEAGSPTYIIDIKEVKDILISEDDYYLTHYRCGDLKEDGELYCRKHAVR